MNWSRVDWNFGGMREGLHWIGLETGTLDSIREGRRGEEREGLKWPGCIVRIRLWLRLPHSFQEWGGGG